MKALARAVLSMLVLVTNTTCESRCGKDTLNSRYDHADVVVVARIVEVAPAVGVWSGLFSVVQLVRYEVVEQLKGEAHPATTLWVAHYVVRNSQTADKDKAQLNPELFARGKTLVLFLSPNPQAGYLSSGGAKGDYVVEDANCGAPEATTRLLKHLRARMKGRKMGPTSPEEVINTQ